MTWVFHSEGVGVRRVTPLRVFCRDRLLTGLQDEAVPGDLHGRLAEEDVRPAGASDWGAAGILPHRPHPAFRTLRLRFPEGQVHGRPGVPFQVNLSMQLNGCHITVHCNVK